MTTRPRRSAIAAVSSVLPSSTRMISSTTPAGISRTVGSRVFPAFRAGMTATIFISGWARSEFLTRDSFDRCAERLEFFLNPFVTAVKMVHAQHFRSAFGDEAGENEARGGAQVSGHDLCAGQSLHTPHE